MRWHDTAHLKGCEIVALSSSRKSILISSIHMYTSTTVTSERKPRLFTEITRQRKLESRPAMLSSNRRFNPSNLDCSRTLLTLLKPRCLPKSFTIYWAMVYKRQAPLQTYPLRVLRRISSSCYSCSLLLSLRTKLSSTIGPRMCLVLLWHRLSRELQTSASPSDRLYFHSSWPYKRRRNLQVASQKLAWYCTG